MKKILTILAIAALSFASCTKNGGNSGTTPTEDKITIANANDWDASNAASSNGGEFRLNINATTNWTAETDAEWLIIDPAEGPKGDNVITLATFPNANPESLTATVTIKAGTATETLTFTQNAASGEGKITPNVLNFDKSAGTLTFTVQSSTKAPHVEWLGYNDGDDPTAVPEWAELTLPNAPEGNIYTYTVKVKENTTGQERKAGIAVCIDNCQNVTVNQSAN